MHAQLPAALLGVTLGPEDALGVVPFLIGPVVRHVYIDEHEARTLAMRALARASEALIAEEGEAGRVGRLLDWYVAAREGHGTCRVMQRARSDLAPDLHSSRLFSA